MHPGGADGGAWPNTLCTTCRKRGCRIPPGVRSHEQQANTNTTTLCTLSGPLTSPTARRGSAHPDNCAVTTQFICFRVVVCQGMMMRCTAASLGAHGWVWPHTNCPQTTLMLVQKAGWYPGGCAEAGSEIPPQSAWLLPLIDPDTMPPPPRMVTCDLPLVRCWRTAHFLKKKHEEGWSKKPIRNGLGPKKGIVVHAVHHGATRLRTDGVQAVHNVHRRSALSAQRCTGDTKRCRGVGGSGAQEAHKR